MTAGIAAIALIVAWLLSTPSHPANARPVRPIETAVPAAVGISPDGLLSIDPSSPLRQRLGEAVVASRAVSFATIKVSGSILARIRKGDEPIEDRWQFASSELATSYADWVRTSGEIEFARSQLAKTGELSKAQVDFLEANVRRMQPLVEKGSIAIKEFKSAEAELLKAQLQGDKDVFAAQSTLRIALKTKTALERDLSQEGIEPVVFGRAVEDMVLIAANVPESRVAQVREGQSCLAKFYAFPEHPFDGHVETLGSLLSTERRTLRVLFELNDPDGLLRPGMFAEVGLGTDRREALMVPADALLHLNLDDYVVVAAGEGLWCAERVSVGERHDDEFEVLEGIAPGQTIVSRNAILLKPAIAQSLLRNSN